MNSVALLCTFAFQQEFMNDISREVHNAYEVIKDGGIILYPTDTVWGIGCDASNADAVAKIFALKKRADSKSMIVLVNGDHMMHQLFSNVPDVAWQILDLASGVDGEPAKPTTLILDNPRNVAPNIVAEDKSLGVRIVTEPFCFKLMERMKKPLVSTSANISGQPTPSSFKEISREIVSGVDYVVNLHRDRQNPKPSSIIKLTNDSRVTIIRK